MSPLARLLSLPVHLYRLTLSPFLGHGCRYQPTCSVYALDALRGHGGIRGGYMAARRLLRCHPWGASGWDPVPDRWPGWASADRKRPETEHPAPGRESGDVPVAARGPSACDDDARAP